MNFLLEHLPENIMTLIVTTIVITTVAKMTSIILKSILILGLIAFLIYMFINYGPGTMQMAPGSIIESYI